MEEIALPRESSPSADDPFMGPLSRLLRFAFLTAAGLMVAFVTSLLAMMTLGDISRAILGPSNAWFAIVGFIPAFTWVWCGAQVMRDPRYRLAFAAILFVAGAMVAWDVMWAAGNSPWYGIVDQFGAYAGGGIGLILACLGRRSDHRSALSAALVMGLALPLVAMTCAVARAWTAPPLGEYALAHIGDEAFEVRIMPEEASGVTSSDSVLVIWAKGSSIEPVARGVEGGTLRVQRDFRSGGWEEYRASNLAADPIRPIAERAAAAYMREQVHREIRDHMTAPVCARLPLPPVDLSGVQFFRIVKATRT